MTTRIWAASCLALAGLAGSAPAKQATVFATGLKNPSQLILAGNGSLLVAETDAPLNSGRISVVDAAGRVQPLLEGLPSGPAAPDGTLDGPNGLALDGRTLFIAHGEGDTHVPARSPGTIVPNPAGRSSPIYSSILKVTFSDDPARIQQPFVLSRALQDTLADGNPVTLENGAGDTARLEPPCLLPARIQRGSRADAARAGTHQALGVARDRDLRPRAPHSHLHGARLRRARSLRDQPQRGRHREGLPAMTQLSAEQEIRSLLAPQTDAWNRGDAAAFAADASEEIWFTNILGQSATGKRAFLDRHEAIFRTIFSGSRLEQEMLRWRLIAPGAAMVETRVTLTGFCSLPPGITAAADGALHTRLLQVLFLEDGRWRIAAYHNVAVSPAAAGQ